MIQLHGMSNGPDTIEALRFVKDSILIYGSIFDIPITKSLLQAAKLAHSRYQADLEVKCKLKEDEEKAKLLKQSGDAKKKSFARWKKQYLCFYSTCKQSDSRYYLVKN